MHFPREFRQRAEFITSNRPIRSFHEFPDCPCECAHEFPVTSPYVRASRPTAPPLAQTSSKPCHATGRRKRGCPAATPHYSAPCIAWRRPISGRALIFKHVSFCSMAISASPENPHCLFASTDVSQMLLLPEPQTRSNGNTATMVTYALSFSPPMASSMTCG